jgi:hypothetical protein
MVVYGSFRYLQRLHLYIALIIPLFYHSILTLILFQELIKLIKFID